MKVAIIHPFYPPHLGGGEIHVKNLAHELDSRKIKTFVITANEPKSEKREKISENLTILRYDPLINLGGIDPIFISYIRDLIKLNIQLIHIHGNMFSISFITALVSKLIRKPIIITLHNLSVGKNALHNFILRIRFIAQSLIIFKLSKKIIVLTNSQKEYLIRHKINANKIQVIPNAINIKKISKNYKKSKKIERFKDQFNLENKFLLLYVGRLMYQKGVSFLIKSLPDLINSYPNLLLLLVGTGPLYKQLKNLVFDLNLENNAFILGRISDNLLIYLYINSDCVIIPSIFEGIPTVMLEALFFNKKIIMTNLPEIRNYIENEKDAILIPSRDVDMLKKSIKEIIENKIPNLGVEGNKIIFKEFSWNKNAEKILNLYKQAL